MNKEQLNKELNELLWIEPVVDFFEPANFVKLLEMLYSLNSNLLDASYQFTIFNGIFVENFLSELGWELLNRKTISEKLPNSEEAKERLDVLQKAQQTEWER